MLFNSLLLLSSFVDAMLFLIFIIYFNNLVVLLLLGFCFKCVSLCLCAFVICFFFLFCTLDLYLSSRFFTFCQFFFCFGFFFYVTRLVEDPQARVLTLNSNCKFYARIVNCIAHFVVAVAVVVIVFGFFLCDTRTFCVRVASLLLRSLAYKYRYLFSLFSQRTKISLCVI